MLKSRSVVLNLFAEGRQNQPYGLVRAKNKKYFILTQVNWYVCFIAEQILFHKLEVLLKAAENRTKGAWEPHAALRTAVEKHWCG